MRYTPNGWPASPDPDAIGVKPMIFPTTNETIYLKKSVAPVLFYIVRQFDARVEDVAGRPMDDWGYSYRENTNNSSKLSEHSAGTAMDVNATQHPNGASGTFSRTQQLEIATILADVNKEAKVVRWGGEFDDEMHWEIYGTQAEVDAVIERLHLDENGNQPGLVGSEVDMFLGHASDNRVFLIDGAFKTQISATEVKFYTSKGVKDFGVMSSAMLNRFPTTASVLALLNGLAAAVTKAVVDAIRKPIA